MNKILIPVDFSEDSLTAIRYGCQLISQNERKQEVDLIHVFTHHSNSYVNRQAYPIEDPQVKISEKDMERLLTNLHNEYPRIKFNSIFKEGNLFEEISKVTAAFNYDAVVMGTKGSSGLEAIFLGSNTYDVILNTKTPVLGVPQNTKGLKKDRVGLLCNFKEGEIEVLQQAIKLIGNDFELVLIYVNKDDRRISDIDAQFKNWIEEIINRTGVQNISYTIKPQVLYNRAAENVSHAISNVLIDEQIDFLLITRSRKSIFRKLIEENIVRKMAYNMTIPTLFAPVRSK
ncbi:universal stress protein [Sphingobacterium chuzhouense]|uniref:Universal stress protein n=1 Tax=Sphingobacterium chuzhouense TaxID=1742264 RepID=A0ABR7XU02_9SPHI|nr:universal stress protein [Sphingobacterium chuzhouense]MBD1422224.1 universal stress protein [Sphingobacterium chuzhouense]